MTLLGKKLAFILGTLLVFGLSLESNAERATPCSVAHLLITPGPTDAGMSKVEVTFRVENQGNRPCVLEGRPIVRARGSRGTFLRFSHPAPQHKPEPLTQKHSSFVLKNGQSAEFSIFFGTSGPYQQGQCPDRTTELLVSLPGKTGTKKVNVDLDICTRLSVSPFLMGQAR